MGADPDPASWFLVEPGWEVVDDGGERVGKVHQVLGDQQKDIFDGLVVDHGLTGGRHYVPADAVARIVSRRVALSVGGDALDRVEDDDEAPGGADVGG